MTNFFTICATNYLAFARQLGDSVLAFQPGASFTVWLLDRSELPDLPPAFSVRYVDELLPAAELERLSFYYTLIERATAVKPLCFRQHFQDGAASVVYLDPDIVLFRPLTAVAELLDGGAAGVLTPHITEPLPRDGAAPDDLVLLQAGVFNLGFLALARGRSADDLLDWWWGWLRTQCFADKLSGTFTDQKWLNFAPVFWPELSVLRDTTYNVAYWNLPQRRLERPGDGADYTVDGRPLTFFHFSGFDPEEPGVLSKHQSRIDVARRSPLAALLSDYARRVLAAGHATLKTQTPPPVTFDNGIALDPIARVAFREALREGLTFRDPRSTGIGSFFRWLVATVPRDLQSAATPALSRYMVTLYQLRDDVRRTYPDLFGADRQGLLAWAAQQAVPEMGADPAMIRRLLGEAAVPEDARSEAAGGQEAVGEGDAPEAGPPGVHLVGYLSAALGLGEAARGYARAMHATDIPLALTDVTHLTASPIDEAVKLPDAAAESAACPVNLIHVNADQLLRLRDEAGNALFAGRYNIGVWAWETREFPEAWHDRFPLLQEVWVPSAFIADAVAAVSPLPTVRMPHVIEVPDVPSDRKRFGLAEDACVFLFYFDFHSTAARKNPAATIAAFRRAYAPGDKACLVLKSINGRSCPADLSALKRDAEGLPVIFIDDALDGDARYALLAACDCFVSLHRAEGFGLGLAEAMAMGKPVIATGWSGNMDFMTASNSFPVDFTLAPLEEEAPPYPAGTVWAQPDVDHAARLMRRVIDAPDAAREVGRRARRDIEVSHAPEVVGRLILDRLQCLERLGCLSPPGRMPPPGAPSHESVASAPPVVQARSLVFRGLRKVFRLLLAVAPNRYHPRLHRLNSRFRSFLAVG